MNLDQLNKIAEEYKAKKAAFQKKVCVCVGTGCNSAGSSEVVRHLHEELEKRKLEGTYDVVPVGCRGACSRGPIVDVFPEDVVYQKITSETVPAIIDQHLLNNKVLRGDMIFSEQEDSRSLSKSSEHPFFSKQVKIVLEHCGTMDPESLEEYISKGGYQALSKALTQMSPEDVIAEIKQSRLRGRGGAGFPTGLKWETVYKYVNETKYVICNGDEGDPGAFMDRSVMEGDPHKVIEGMIIAAYAVGASQGYVYVRAEYPLAIKRLELAIKACLKNGLLGKNIFESGFAFDLSVRIGAGAFVCG